MTCFGTATRGYEREQHRVKKYCKNTTLSVKALAPLYTEGNNSYFTLMSDN